MREYELVLVLKASLSETQQKKLIETISGWLNKDIKITKKEEWGQKPLSYPIKKEVAGVFLDWYLEAEEKIPQDFEKKLLANEDILRHLLIRKR